MILQHEIWNSQKTSEVNNISTAASSVTRHRNVKRCVIATDHLRLSAGPTHKTTHLFLSVSSEYCHYRQVYTVTTKNQPKDTNNERGDCCGVMREKWKHRQLPLRDTSQDRKQRGQYGSLVQWKPEELLSLCSYSCALWEVSAHWSLGQKRQVQRASSTLADRQNRGQTLRS